MSGLMVSSPMILSLTVVSVLIWRLMMSAGHRFYGMLHSGRRKRRRGKRESGGLRGRVICRKLKLVSFVKLAQFNIPAVTVKLWVVRRCCTLVGGRVVQMGRLAGTLLLGQHLLVATRMMSRSGLLPILCSSSGGPGLGVD